MENHDTLTKTTLLICKANVKRRGLSTRGRERKLRAFYCGDAGKHPMFCFAFRRRVRKRDWIGLLSAGSPVIYSMVILAHPLHSLSFSSSIYHLDTTPAHLSLTVSFSFSLSFTHLCSIFLFQCLHLVKFKGINMIRSFSEEWILPLKISELRSIVLFSRWFRRLVQDNRDDKHLGWKQSWEYRIMRKTFSVPPPECSGYFSFQVRFSVNLSQSWTVNSRFKSLWIHSACCPSRIMNIFFYLWKTQWLGCKKCFATGKKNNKPINKPLQISSL